MIRLQAAQLFAQVLEDGKSLTELHLSAEQSYSGAELSQIKYLTFEACRYYFRYLAVLDQLMDKPFKSKDSDLLALIMIAMHEIAQANKADHAAVNETVEAVKQLKKQWAAKLVNALLRQWQRQLEDPDAPWLQDVRFQTAHPGWMYKRIRKSWPDQAEAIFNANNTQAPMTLRVNRLKNSRAEYLTKLQQKGIAAVPTSMSADGIQLEKPLSVLELPEFFEGYASVQDEAAQMAALLLQANESDLVLDACCAPGGKTGHLLELGVTQLIAVDADERRLARVHENLSRLKLNANVKQADLTQSDWWDGQPFDRILLDAPCSATGVIRRHPDIKLHRTAADIAALVDLQREILQRLWSMLKPGGILLYATCSILPAENQHQIESFLSMHTDAKLLPLVSGEERVGELDAFNGQLLPKVSGQDGFYFAKLQKLEQ